jgi:anti-sigma regulatory factor (Ser/Thr protein kinase)
MDSPRRIQLIAPAERGSVRLARILAAGVAADAGLSIDDTEDLRIAVSELVALLVDGLDDPSLSIEVAFIRDVGEVVIEGNRPAAAGRPDIADVDDLALEILRVVVDDHTFDAGASGRRFRLVKRTRARS